MIKLVKNTLLLSSSMVFLITMQPAHADGLITWIGHDLTENSNFTYLGGVKALNNDLNSSGYLLHGSLGIGEYDYNNGISRIDGDHYAASFSVGYVHFFSTDTRLTGYLGAAYEDHDLSVNDPNNTVDGSELGIATNIEFYTKPTENISVNLLTNYSTAHDSYWVRTRMGYDFGPVKIGPEVIALGNKHFDQQRYGLTFTGIKLSKHLSLEASVGHSNGSRDDKNSPYANIALHTNW